MLDFLGEKPNDEKDKNPSEDNLDSGNDQVQPSDASGEGQSVGGESVGETYQTDAPRHPDTNMPLSDEENQVPESSSGQSIEESNTGSQGSEEDHMDPKEKERWDRLKGEFGDQGDKQDGVDNLQSGESGGQVSEVGDKGSEGGSSTHDIENVREELDKVNSDSQELQNGQESGEQSGQDQSDEQAVDTKSTDGERDTSGYVTEDDVSNEELRAGVDKMQEPDESAGGGITILDGDGNLRPDVKESIQKEVDEMSRKAEESRQKSEEYDRRAKRLQEKIESDPKEMTVAEVVELQRQLQK